MTKLQRFFAKACDELGLDYAYPFRVTRPEGIVLNAAFFIRGIGGTEGMLVFTNRGMDVHELGKSLGSEYGFTSMDEFDEGMTYNREDFIEMFRDWGWAAGGPAPSWVE